MDVMKPWIAKLFTELLGFEVKVLINFIYGLLEVKGGGTMLNSLDIWRQGKLLDLTIQLSFATCIRWCCHRIMSFPFLDIFEPMMMELIDAKAVFLHRQLPDVVTSMPQIAEDSNYYLVVEPVIFA